MNPSGLTIASTLRVHDVQTFALVLSQKESPAEAVGSGSRRQVPTHLNYNELVIRTLIAQVCVICIDIRIMHIYIYNCIQLLVHHARTRNKNKKF